MADRLPAAAGTVGWAPTSPPQSPMLRQAGAGVFLGELRVASSKVQAPFKVLFVSHYSGLMGWPRAKGWRNRLHFLIGRENLWPFLAAHRTSQTLPSLYQPPWSVVGVHGKLSGSGARLGLTAVVQGAQRLQTSLKCAVSSGWHANPGVDSGVLFRVLLHPKGLHGWQDDIV